MWRGALRGFAGLKFSTSPRRFGSLEIRVSMRPAIRIIGMVSFTEKKGLNFILSGFV